MKKQLLTVLSIMTLGSVMGGVIPNTDYALTSVQAQISEMSIEELREFVLNGSPMTQTHWEQIPDEALLRYARNAGPTMVSDQIFNAAFAEYPSVFASDVERVKSVLMSDYGVTQDEILAVGEGYLLWDEWFKHGDLSVVASQLKQTEDTSEEYPVEEGLPHHPTREEAEELANGEWGQVFRSHILSRISEETLAQLPENAIFEAAVAYKMEFPIGVNPNVSFDYFKNMYPEAFAQDTEESDVTEEISEEASDIEVVLPETEGQKNIDNHITQATEEVELEELDRNQIFTIDSIEYTVKNVYLLENEEAENQGESEYLLGIRYEYNGEDEQIINLHEQTWESNARLTQAEGVLSVGSYDYSEDASTSNELDESMESTDEVTSGVVYYEVKDTETPLTLSVSTDNGVEQYTINPEELLQLPPQSGLFLNSEAAIRGYLFDFETLYLIYNSVEEATEWDGLENVQVDVEVDEGEATTQLEQLENSQDLVYVAIQDVYYNLSEEGNVEVKVDSEEDEEGTVLFEITTASDSITVNDTVYELVETE